MDPNMLNPNQQPTGYVSPRPGNISPQPMQPGQLPPNSIWYPSAINAGYGSAGFMNMSRPPPVQKSDIFVRNNCGPHRPFVMHIQDNNGLEVIRIIRPYRYKCMYECCSCCDCCQDEVEVQAPVGNVIGYVKQSLAGCKASYKILDSHRKKVLLIRGPRFCTCECYGRNINFNVMSRDGSTQIGTVSKQWTNLLQEYFTDADNFGITFPMDLDVKFKAILLAAVFLIDYMYFERGNYRRRY